MMSLRFALVSLITTTTAACVTDEPERIDHEIPELPLGGKTDGSYAFYGVTAGCQGVDCGFDLQSLNGGETSRVRGMDWPQFNETTRDELSDNLYGARVIILAGTYERELDDGTTAPWAKAYRTWLAASDGFTPGTPTFTWLTKKREFCFQEPCVMRFDQYVLNGPQLDPVTEVSMDNINADPEVIVELEQQLASGEGILVLGQTQDVPGGSRFVVSRAYVPR